MSAKTPVLSLVRPEILALSPYSSARKESKGGRIWLDANENPKTPAASLPSEKVTKESGLNLNRYPDPQPPSLVEPLAAIYGVAATQVLVTRGADEGIDLLLRTFCRAGQDAILITPPTYGMYVVAAGIQNARVITVPLLQEKNFALDVDSLLKAITPDVKIVFLCSPNNPTGQLLERSSVLRIISTLATRAIVAVDEAYVEFSGQPSLAAELSAHANLVVLRTLSKAYGLAGARVGVTLASPEIIAVLQKVIAPYPLPAPVVTAVQRALSPEGLAAMRESTQVLISERERLLAALPKIPTVKRVWPSHANYILIETSDSSAVMATGRSAGIIWRDRNKDVRNNVRITIGTPDENNATLEALARV